MTVKGIIAKLERLRSDLKEIVDALQRLDGFGSLKGATTLSLDQLEKRLVTEALERAGGNQTQAAQILQVSRDKVRYKMAKHGLGRKKVGLG